MRLWAALGCAALALGAASYAVRSALKVAFTGYTELNSLGDDDVAHAQANPALLDGFATIAEIRETYYDCIATRHRHLVEGANANVIQTDNATFRYLDGLVDDILSYIRYNRIRLQAEDSRTELGFASVIAAVGLVGFAWAANPAKDTPTIVLRAPASEAQLTLTDAGKKTLGPVLGASCAAMDRINVIVLSVSGSGSELVSLKTKDCLMAKFTLTDALGKLASTSP